MPFVVWAVPAFERSGHGIIADVSGFEVARMMERLRAGDVRALARAVSMVEDGAATAGELLAAFREAVGSALRGGVTGPPGAGKSTLVDQMAKWLRAEGQMVGVVAVDPSSPYTGGALLGDRIRMQGFGGGAGEWGVFTPRRGAGGGGGWAGGGGGGCLLGDGGGGAGDDFDRDRGC